MPPSGVQADNKSLTHEEAVARARALAPAIAARAHRAEQERHIPRESIEEFVAAGLARVLQPRRWGGHEISHAAAFDVAVEIAAACGSTGWCTSLLNMHDWWLSAFPDEAQHDVWRDTPDVNLAAVISPLGGKATPVDGGYRITGHWGWASGIDHCQWLIVTAMTAMGDGPPEARCFVVPAKDCAVEDTWFNVGLKGTGSKDIDIDDIFVPAHRSVSMADLREATTPGVRANPGPIYRVPLIARNYALAAPALGIARGAFADWLGWTRTRVASFTGEAIAAQGPVQTAISEVEAQLDAAEFLMRRNLEFIRDGKPVDLPTRALCSYANAHAVQVICQAVDTLFRLSGSRGMFEKSPIQRAWRDVHTLSSHVSLNPTAAGQLRGRAMLGIPRDPKMQMY
ncbi:MAG TPA: acyl-CoA dehydrogenase family protein [Stellaceae bacterium]|nr:acyl-CoA dehydrogenase family protein [Stellaceae bacterium]